jgi:hypothetical protein
VPLGGPSRAGRPSGLSEAPPPRSGALRSAGGLGGHEACAHEARDHAALPVVVARPEASAPAT